MDDITLLVLATPTEPQLAMLEALPANTTIAAGKVPEAFERTAADADVILNWSAPLDCFEQVWQIAPRVRWVHSRSAGLDNVLFPALIKSPVPLTNGRGVFSASLGEFAIAAALFFAKGLRRMVSSQAAGLWDPFDIVDLRTQTMSIIGYGDIGRAVAERAHAMGMKVLALRRRPELSREDPFVDELFRPDEKMELLSRSDYVVLAAPLTADSRGMIAQPELEAMKPTAVLINIGRGPVVDEAALVDALKIGRIRGAALDVFDTEPLPSGHPFYRLENVLLSPHCADHTPDWKEQAMQFFLENFERFRKGEPLKNVVDKKLGY
jgi:phosphoglycerate dehydrogenase-like enzyme